MTREEIIRFLRWHQAWHGLSEGQIEAVADVLATDVEMPEPVAVVPEPIEYTAIYVPPGQHDYRNWQTCMCGQPGCGSYRPFPGGPSSRELRAQREREVVPIPVVSPDRKIIINPI